MTICRVAWLWVTYCLQFALSIFSDLKFSVLFPPLLILMPLHLYADLDKLCSQLYNTLTTNYACYLSYHLLYSPICLYLDNSCICICWHMGVFRCNFLHYKLCPQCAC
ncbi:hypothetical protein AMTRI_Chr11g156490 [Amborella trichopoda]